MSLSPCRIQYYAFNYSCWCLGIDTKFKGQHYPIMIAVSHVPELQQITQEDDGIRVGAAVTLNALKGALEKVITEQPGKIEIKPVHQFVKMSLN